MKTPIPVLKSRAKALARQDRISLSKALDRVAQTQGHRQWSHLVAAYAPDHASRLLAKMVPGDLVLLGARPGKGKTLLALGLLVAAIKQGRTGAFFTFEYTVADVLDRLHSIGAAPQSLGDAFVLDTSDAISADYIIDRIAALPAGTMVVVDYLQLLDQNRNNPNLATQVEALRACVQESGHIIVLISQIDRQYVADHRPYPDLSDVRLPNPVDLSLFTKACFIGQGGVQIIDQRI